MKLLLIIVTVLIVLGLGLRIWRFLDERALDRVWTSLVSDVEATPAVFRHEMTEALPLPARRFFKSVIEPGTPLYHVAEISMRGEFSLGTKEAPAYQPMKACQLLAAPQGFFWQGHSGRGLTSFIGSDAAFPGGSWTRFWLAGLIPVVRVGNTPDHAMSSFGRYMAEAIFWTPAALLLPNNVNWHAVDENTVQVTVKHNDIVQTFELVIDSDGRLEHVQFQRWTNANKAKVYQRQSFGGHLSDFKRIDGFWVPTTVEAGNHFGSEDYFAFFKATIDRVVFIKQPDQHRSCSLP